MPGADEAQFAQLDPNLPIALLPARLEVRYGGEAGVSEVLRVRIYPDDISIRRDRTGLTEAEIAAGRRYWETITDLSAGASQSLTERGAWEQLARQVGPYRASYVVEHTEGGAQPEARKGRPAALASLLPDKWVVSGWVGESDKPAFTVSTGAVKPDLAVSMAQDDDLRLAVKPESAIKLDEDTLWLADYDKAVAVGMAVTIDLRVDGNLLVPEGKGISRLMAFGIRIPPAGADAGAQAEDLHQLIDTHNRSHGARFLKPGTPTNNLKGTRSAWTSQPAAASIQPTIRDLGPLGDERELLRGGAGGSSGRLLEHALGMTPGMLSGLEGADRDEQALARNMNVALFPVTWGELLGNLLLPNLFLDGETDAEEEGLARLSAVHSFAKQHFRDFVRARGPLPTVLLGRQPYGVLPITSHARWRRQNGEAPKLDDLSTLLRRLRRFWVDSAQRAPKLRNLNLDDAAKRLVEILGMGPVPHPRGYAVRTVKGENATLAASVAQPALDTDDSLQKTIRDAIYRLKLAAIPSIPTDARLLKYQIDDPVLLTIPAVDLSVPYLDTLAVARTAEILGGTLWNGEQPKDLLCALLVRSLLIANEQSALALLRELNPTKREELLSASRGELSAVGVAGHPSASTLLFNTSVSNFVEAGRVPDRVLDKHLSELVEDRDGGWPFIPVQDFDPGLVFEPGPPPTRFFLDTRDAIAALSASAPDEEDLTRLMGETLALCSTRLDAWITSIATVRLETLRKRNPTGIQIGSYGWLVDLPAWQAPQTPANPAGRDAGGTLVAPRRQVGWVHAPSIAQAQTASVLRAAELSHEGSQSNVSSIDLTSRRVRAATELLDAVQNGQPLGAVLGYRLERSLHDTGKHVEVGRLRARFPQRSVSEQENDPEQAIPRDVVDGEQAWTMWRRWKGGEAALTPVFEGLDDQMGQIDALVEAVADVLVANGVHNIVTGSPQRAVAGLNAIAVGDPPPPDLEVARSPRSGSVITHKVVLLLDRAPGNQGWSNTAPRAKLMPGLEGYARALLGGANGWSVKVGDQTVSLTAVNPPLSALDVLSEISGAAGLQSPLAERIAASIGPRRSPVSDDDSPRSWNKLTALAATAKEVLANCRPLTQRDLESPDTEPAEMAPPTLQDLSELENAMEQALAEVQAAVETLETAFAAVELPGPGDLRLAVRQLARYGVPGAVLVADAEMVEVGRTAMSSGRATLNAVQATFPADRATDRRTPLEKATAILRALFGPLAAPSVRLDAAGLAAAAVDTVGSGELERWFFTYGQVRPALMTLGDLRSFAAVVAGEGPDAPRAYQIPEWQGPWLGGPLDEGHANAMRRYKAPQGSRVHLVAFGSAQPAETVEALLVDQWTEAIPSRTQLTGVGVHYDAPGARAPQAILLALHPDPQGAEPWSSTMVADMLRDTIELASIRAVDTTQLGPTALDQFLPVIYARDGIDNVTDLHKVILHWPPELITEMVKANIGEFIGG